MTAEQFLVTGAGDQFGTTLQRKPAGAAPDEAHGKQLVTAADGSAKRLLAPVEVSDVADPKLVHLAGLNLSRAWALAGIARGLPVQDLRVKRLAEAAVKHAEKGLGYVFSGHYEGEHWLATFAIYALSEGGGDPRPAR